MVKRDTRMVLFSRSYVGRHRRTAGRHEAQKALRMRAFFAFVLALLTRGWATLDRGFRALASRFGGRHLQPVTAEGFVVPASSEAPPFQRRRLFGNPKIGAALAAFSLVIGLLPQAGVFAQEVPACRRDDDYDHCRRVRSSRG